MEKLTILLITVAILATKTIQAIELAKNFKESSETFSASLYRNVIKNNNEENVIISPFSIQTAAALAFVGASGETAEQMIQGLKLISSDRDTVASAFKNVLDQHKNNSAITVANKLYLSPSLETFSNFLKLATENFDSEVENIDFSDATRAAQTINDWVEERTEGKIHKLIDQKSIDSFTSGYIINAIHFKGLWAQKFKKEKTKPGSFWVNKTNFVQVDMMQNVGRYRTGFMPELDATAIELPFENSNLSMVIILPDENTELKTLEEALLQDNFKGLPKRFSAMKINLVIPRFKVEFSTGLKEAFKEMGMTKMFVNAEFYNLSKEYLEISEIQHKAAIEVNEEGAEASAASAMQLSSRSGPIPFIVDRPFLYYIKGEQGEIYFIGRFIKP